MGMTRKTPSASATIASSQYSTQASGCMNRMTPRARATTAHRALATFRSGLVYGWPGMTSWSLAQATMLPEKVTPPMMPDAIVAIITCVGLDPEPAIASITPTPSPSPPALEMYSWNTAPATNTEATPPKPLYRATSWGMPVIWIMMAAAAPMPPPMTTPAMIQPQPRMFWSMSVTTMATNMPSAPSRLPRTAVRGWVRPLMPKMNSTAARM
jgi:hypothetical protein